MKCDLVSSSITKADTNVRLCERIDLQPYQFALILLIREPDVCEVSQNVARRNRGEISNEITPALPCLEKSGPEIQLRLFDCEWLTEAEAAEYLERDEKTLRWMRSDHCQGITLCHLHDGIVYYRRDDLVDWKANNAQRKTGTCPAKLKLNKGILP